MQIDPQNQEIQIKHQEFVEDTANDVIENEIRTTLESSTSGINLYSEFDEIVVIMRL